MSQRPARIRTELRVTLPRPRTRELLTSPEFVAQKREILELLVGERFAAAERS